MRRFIIPIALTASVVLGPRADASLETCAARCTAAKLGQKLRAERPKIKIIVTSDLEIDDVASFHRLLLYANDLADELAGIVYSSSSLRYSGDPDAKPPIPAKRWDGVDDFPPGVKRLGTFEDIIGGTGHFGAGGGYRAAWPKLKLHDPRYPTPEHLLSLVKVGNITNVGEMDLDTPGSDLIKRTLLERNATPVWLLAWGGTNTIAAALRSIHDEFAGRVEWPAIRARVLRKARLYLILDQDPAYMGYIRPNWPELAVIVNRQQWLPMAYSFLRRGPVGGDNVPASLEGWYGPAFIEPVLKGPMMRGYPRGPAYFEKVPGAYVSEGDTPSFLYLLPTGLESFDNPGHGGWGGRFLRTDVTGWSDDPGYLRGGAWVEPRVWFDGLKKARSDPSPVASDTGADEPGALISRSYPQARWIPAIQRDFAARATWETAAWESANHPPVAYIAVPLRKMIVRPGRTVAVSAKAADPDGDVLHYRWWHYQEAGTFPGKVEIMGANTLTPRVAIPHRAVAGHSIHLILEVTDSGTPSLTRYQRVVLSVK